MQICVHDTNGFRKQQFSSGALINAAVFLDERVLLNKAVLDVSTDIQTIASANNKIERKERFNR